MILSVFVTAIIGVLWVANSYSYHSSRDGAATHILLVGLDSRSAEDAGLPDSLTLIDLGNGDVSPISRSWELSRIEPNKKLVPLYVGMEACEPFCGVQGLYAFSKGDGDTDEANQKALDTLARVVEREYGLVSLGVVAFDLQWAQGFLNNVAPIQFDVKSPVPVGGRIVNDEYSEVRRYITPGLKDLSGQDAFWVARARYGSSNEDRIARQLELLESIRAQKSAPQLFFGALSADGKLWTDIQSFEVMYLVGYFQPQ